MIKNIVFDLGGVLIDWKPEYVYRTIFNTEEEVRWFLDNITTSAWNALQDKGRPIARANAELIRVYPQWQKEIEAFYGRWTEMLGGEIEETVRILEDLEEMNHYRLFALTNWSHETFPIAWERYDFLDIFRDIVVSGFEKHIKPEPEIYQILLKRNSLKAEECIFIDDNEANIRTGEKLGITSLLFKNADLLRRQLNDILKTPFG